MERAIDLSEEAAVFDIYKIDILTAVKSFNIIWNLLAPSIIENCWRHTGLFGKFVVEITSEESEKVLDTLSSNVDVLVPQYAYLSIEEL